MWWVADGVVGAGAVRAAGPCRFRLACWVGLFVGGLGRLASCDLGERGACCGYAGCDVGCGLGWGSFAVGFELLGAAGAAGPSSLSGVGVAGVGVVEGEWAGRSGSGLAGRGWWGQDEGVGAVVAAQVLFVE